MQLVLLQELILVLPKLLGSLAAKAGAHGHASLTGTYLLLALECYYALLVLIDDFVIVVNHLGLRRERDSFVAQRPIGLDE